jgi:hypothetical protein
MPKSLDDVMMYAVILTPVAFALGAAVGAILLGRAAFDEGNSPTKKTIFIIAGLLLGAFSLAVLGCYSLLFLGNMNFH